jgi:hypothetical protein
VNGRLIFDGFEILGILHYFWSVLKTRSALYIQSGGSVAELRHNTFGGWFTGRLCQRQYMTVVNIDD